MLERVHANVNHDGRNFSLLAGIFRGRDFDKRQWENVCVFEQYNVPDSYRNKSELARSIQADKRAEKRRKDKQPLKSKVSSASKKQKCNSQNKENENEVIVIDDDNLFDQQVKINKRIREIMLLEKRNRILAG
ncbi:hypothetical protein RclHR1_04370011 [Rhizophagus clarus]|uniref:Uncharacterized protein n=1 Tax=Rhizophagus clarus TaxID=94130 RepID=A0A2Z6RY77_9GLOM|nr:hypothetical protein RclHR1_04370011 [Rhizophagus clarus]GES86309.1 hypothetical protein GLOIN_2v1764634 [Rhizophagus clarus]